MNGWRVSLLPGAFVVALISGCGGGGPAIEDDVTAGDGALDGAGGADERRAAVASLLDKATHDPTEPYWHYAAAKLRAEAGETSEALESLRASLDRDATYEPAAALFASLSFERGGHEDAIAVLEPCAESFTASPAILTALALHYDAAGRYDEADALRDRLSVPGPHWVDHGSSLAYLHLRSDDFEGAARTAENALIADGGSAANHNNYGISLLYGGDPRAAEEAFRKAIELDPDLPGPYYNLAILTKYYYFDDAAAAQWFAEYERRGNGLDPDGIAAFMNDGDSR